MEEVKGEDNLEPKHGIGKIIVIVIVALIIVAGVGGYMMMSPKSATAPSESPAPTSPAAIEGTSTPGPNRESSMAPNPEGKVIVEGSNFKFAPDKITVKKGQPVTVVFKNITGFHDFVLDEFKVKTKQIKTGEIEEVTFTPDKVGEFEFYCSVGNHRAMGMKGTLSVRE